MANIKQYLNKYSESEINNLAQFTNTKPYENSVVIPAYQENESFISRLIDSPLINKRIILIIIINQPHSDKDKQPQRRLFEQINKFGQKLWQFDNLTLISISKKPSDILVVNRFSTNKSIDDKQGVGLARKIGADIATALIDQGTIKSPWVCSTDADTTLPDNYFSALSEIPENVSAITYGFNHSEHSDQVSAATNLYEKALRYYVSGLKWAGSNYAFHTIGSTLAFRYDYYAMVRGFPKRAAGEDFYLLNKLAKLASIKILDNVTINIQSRLSDRTPFGTGPAVSNILALGDIADYHYYQPELFLELKFCLSAFDELWQYNDNLDVWFNKLSAPIQFGLKQLNFQKLVNHLRKQSSSEQQYSQQIYLWFDAFRTLKFIHYLQEHFYPPIPLKDAMAMAPFDIDN